MEHEYTAQDRRDFYAHDDDCQRCSNPASRLERREGQLVCSNCAEDLDHEAFAEEFPESEVAAALLTVGAPECVACGSIRKTVANDRLYLAKPGAACCGADAA